MRDNKASTQKTQASNNAVPQKDISGSQVIIFQKRDCRVDRSVNNHSDNLFSKEDSINHNQSI